tara:strand:+ start:115 stop:285 length:171 start_codon:yes stop_codon:yes gene_type:complete
MYKLTNPITGKIIKNTTASYKPITQIVEHFWPNKNKLYPKKKPSNVPYYYKNVYKC